jgi:hypothetical protein
MANLIEPTVTTTQLSAEITRRAMLGLFILLTNVCGLIILKPVDDGYLKLVLVSLFEIPIMLVISALFGDKNIVRDINELNFYALLFHLMYLAIYLQEISAIYHNIAVKTLLVLSVLRLVYFGPRTADGDFKGMGVFGILGHVQQLLKLRLQGNKNSLLKYWSHLLFFGSAVPLWLIMMRSSDFLVTGTVAGLMVFIFVMANTMQIELTKIGCGHAAPPDIYSSAPTQDMSHDQNLLRSTVRDVATQFAHAYKTTHPSMQNLNAVVAKYIQRSFPDERVFGPNSISGRRAHALTQLAELMMIAKDQLQQNAVLAQAGNAANLDVDMARLTAKFDASLKFNLDEIGMIAFMDYVMGQPPLELADSTFVLACDVLTTAWLRCLLSSSTRMFEEEYASIDFVTREFLTRFMPVDRSMQ